MQKFNKNYLFVIFYNLFKFNFKTDDRLIQDKPNFDILFKLKLINLEKNKKFYKNFNLINDDEHFSYFYKSIITFCSLIKLITFNKHHFNSSNFYYNGIYYNFFFYYFILEKTYFNTMGGFSLTNFFFLKKKKMQLYLYFKHFLKPLVFSTNGIVNKKIENKKKCMKKLDKVSIINLKMFLKQISNVKNTTNISNNLFVVFFYLRKLYSKLLKILNKEKFHEEFNLNFFFDFKKSYSLNKVKKKRFIKRKLKKKITKIDSI